MKIRNEQDLRNLTKKGQHQKYYIFIQELVKETISKLNKDEPSSILINIKNNTVIMFLRYLGKFQKNINKKKRNNDQDIDIGDKINGETDVT